MKCLKCKREVEEIKETRFVECKYCGFIFRKRSKQASKQREDEMTKFTEAEMMKLKNVRFLTATNRFAEFHYTDNNGDNYALGYIDQEAK